MPPVGTEFTATQTTWWIAHNGNDVVHNGVLVEGGKLSSVNPTSRHLTIEETGKTD